MQQFMEQIRENIFSIVLLVFNIAIFVGTILINIKFNKRRKNTEVLIEELNEGKAVDDILNDYIERVLVLENRINELKNESKIMEYNLSKCIQKIGIVRYNAYKDTRCELSFALALLDMNNNGVIFNGIYATDVTNIFAKPVTKGVCKYDLQDEEKEALKKAINYDVIEYMKD